MYSAVAKCIVSCVLWSFFKHATLFATVTTSFFPPPLNLNCQNCNFALIQKLLLLFACAQWANAVSESLHFIILAITIITMMMIIIICCWWWWQCGCGCNRIFHWCKSSTWTAVQCTIYYREGHKGHATLRYLLFSFFLFYMHVNTIHQ